MIQILAIRVQVEGLVVDEDSLTCLGEIARDTSLSVVAKINGRANICKEDVEEVKAYIWMPSHPQDYFKSNRKSISHDSST
ncbi:hypothetical protein LWI28_027535 [Acer negundo]|uniref:Uncharacterized protein n=1 Tax=Acer negundo TaxID=4023 RepID=A0AAD5J2J5_ACENE|nr:hypothetical protein LWI28_027535 [Acer negundo]